MDPSFAFSSCVLYGAAIDIMRQFCPHNRQAIISAVLGNVTDTFAE